jgi:hypothetical protein
MEMFGEAGSAATLTSPTQGLVGNSVLIPVFEATSRAVIILDEIEKAHESVLNELLLQWINDEGGQFQDKKNTSRTFSTKDCVFILTSNCFASLAPSQAALAFRNNEPSCGPGRPSNPFAREELKRRVVAGHAHSSRSAAENGFVMFNSLEDVEVQRRAARFVLERLSGAYGDRLVWTSRAFERILESARKKSMGMSLFNKEIESIVGEALSTALRRPENSECDLARSSQLLVVGRTTGEVEAVLLDCEPSDLPVDHQQASSSLILRSDESIQGVPARDSSRDNVVDAPIERMRELERLVDPEAERLMDLVRTLRADLALSQAKVEELEMQIFWLKAALTLVSLFLVYALAVWVWYLIKYAVLVLLVFAALLALYDPDYLVGLLTALMVMLPLLWTILTIFWEASGYWRWLAVVYFAVSVWGVARRRRREASIQKELRDLRAEKVLRVAVLEKQKSEHEERTLAVLAELGRVKAELEGFKKSVAAGEKEASPLEPKSETPREPYVVVRGAGHGDDDEEDDLVVSPEKKQG